MMTAIMMLMACFAAWALVAIMLRDARNVLLAALDGQAQGGGWMPSWLPLATPRVSGTVSRSDRRR